MSVHYYSCAPAFLLSFLNIINKMCRIGRTGRKGNTGTAYTFFTQKNGKKIKFRFCDSMGLEGEEGLTSSDMGKIMDGYVENMAEVWSCLFNLKY